MAQKVDDPIDAGTVTIKTPPKLMVGEYRVVLGRANDNLDATRTCQGNQRERLAKGRH